MRDTVIDDQLAKALRNNNTLQDEYNQQGCRAAKAEFLKLWASDLWTETTAKSIVRRTQSRGDWDQGAFKPLEVAIAEQGGSQQAEEGWHTS